MSINILGLKKFLKQQSVMFKEDNYIDAYRMYGRLLRKVKLVDKLKLIKIGFSRNGCLIVVM